MSKVAIINSTLDKGSIGMLTRQLYEYGNEIGWDAYIFFGRGKKYKDSHIKKIDSIFEVIWHKFITILFGVQGCGSKIATRKLVALLKREKIDNVIAINLHGYYINEFVFFTYLKKNNINLVYITADEYPGMGKCCYSYECEKYQVECKACKYKKFYPSSYFFDSSNYIFKMKQREYDGLEKVIFAGPQSNLEKFEKSKLIKNKKMRQLDWGIDLSIYNTKIDEKIYDKYQLPRDKILILAAASYKSRRKGIKEYFFAVANKLINCEKYHFINVGFDGDREKDYVPPNCTVIPYVNDQTEFAMIYAISDLFMINSKQDTMPLSALISLACGTPILSFYLSGLRYIAPKNEGLIYFADENIESLIDIVKSINKKNKKIIDLCRKYAEERYSKELFNKKVFEYLEELNSIV